MNWQALTGEVKRLEALVALAHARAGGAGGGIPLLFDVNAAAAFGYPAPPNAPNQFAAVRNIPGGGTTLALPATAVNGQTCEFCVLDSSCTAANPLIVSGNGHTVLGVATLTFTAPFSWGVATFDATANVWALETVQGTYVNPALSVAAWFINPTAGLDTNNGTTAGTPLKTYRRLVQLWGTTSPVLSQSTTITFQGTGHSDDTDPVVWSPVMLNGTIPAIVGTPNIVNAAVVLGVTTAKARAAAQLLNTTLPAGAAVDQFVVNTTAAKASGAFVYANVAGNVWAMSQPLTRTTIPFGGGLGEVDTWANADTAQSMTFPAVNLVQFTPVFSKFLNGNQGFLQNLLVFDPAAASGNSRCMIGGSIAVQECLCKREMLTSGSPGSTFDFVNVDARGGGAIGNLQADSFMLGGIFDGSTAILSSTLSNVSVDLDTIIKSSQVGMWGSGQPVTGGFGAQGNLGLVYLETGCTLECSGGVGVFGIFTAHPIIWGPGLLNAVGRITYDTGQTAATTFVLTNAAALLINGANTAHSVISGAPDVLNGGITITTAHLDAAAGAAGFGGNAFALGGGSFQKLAA